MIFFPQRSGGVGNTVALLGLAAALSPAMTPLSAASLGPLSVTVIRGNTSIQQVFTDMTVVKSSEPAIAAGAATGLGIGRRAPGTLILRRPLLPPPTGATGLFPTFLYSWNQAGPYEGQGSVQVRVPVSNPGSVPGDPTSVVLNCEYQGCVPIHWALVEEPGSGPSSNTGSTDTVTLAPSSNPGVLEEELEVSFSLMKITPQLPDVIALQ